QVGTAAVERLIGDPRRTVFGAKRFIGREYDSPAVQKMLSRFPYRVVPGGLGRVAVRINGKAVNLTTIAARILQQLKRAVSEQLGVNVTRAVITVPAFYNDNQRQAVVVAGRLAGLQVERIINEPTAAAIAYGLHHSRPRKLVVYDLGGGTFDVSIMEVKNDALTVKATAGDTFLGGEDFDDVIVHHVYEEFRRRHGVALSGNAAERARIKKIAETAKCRLSTHDRAMVTVRDALLVDGSRKRIEIELERETVEKLVAPLIKRTLKITEMALMQAKLPRSQIKDVILVGGQTRMPAVRRAVQSHFKVTPRTDINPDEVVAIGAGLLAGMKDGGHRQFQDVLSMSIGIAAGGKFKPLIPRNTPVPHLKSIVIHVPRERMKTFALQFYQGESSELIRNELLGSLPVDALDVGTSDPVPVQIDLSLSADCLLSVSLTNQTSGQSVNVLLNTRDH
ncbi:MAG: Hsp70 family protein, partial [Myxococcota bacterium]